MRMLGEMATALPKVRSFTEFARAGLGDGAGFVVGWLYWYFWVLVVPVEAIAGAKILMRWIPLTQLQMGLGADDGDDLREPDVGTLVCRIRVLVCLDQSCRHPGVHRHRRVICLWMDRAPRRHLRQPRRFRRFTPNGWIAVLAAVPTVFFAMTGAEITTIAAAESAQPGKAVARMSTAVIGRILIFYVISLFLIVSVTPWNTVRSGESPFTLALNTMHVPWAGEVMSAIILTAVLSCLNSAFYVSSRVLFILAERGDAPQMLVRLNARRVPTASVLIGAAAGFLGIIAATEAPQKVFDFLVSSSGAVIVFVYMAIAFAQIRLRNRRDRAGEPAPAVRCGSSLG
jgi:GABA permease